MGLGCNQEERQNMATTVLARQSRNQKNRNISRKDAKAAKKKK
jgi:hypothetical protein